MLIDGDSFKCKQLAITDLSSLLLPGTLPHSTQRCLPKEHCKEEQNLKASLVTLIASLRFWGA